jgi:hypothetical protein
MKCTHLLTLLFLPIACATVAAQSSEAGKTAPVKNVTANIKTSRDPEAERLLLQRRTQAQSLLISLATDAGTFKDQRLRARTQSRIADVLWEDETDRARSLFRKAWDAAEIADDEARQKLQDDIREQRAKSGGSGYAVTTPPDLRKEVLGLAVKHDTPLAEEFLSKLQEKSKAGPAKENPINPYDTDPASTQRADAAKELLSSGDQARALELASPLLNTISQQAIEFLSSLREKNAALADQRYASLLNLAAANPQSDLNTVALLSSYIFSPHGYVYSIGSGALTNPRTSGAQSLPDVAPALRLAFFQVAAEVLTRPVPPEQELNVLFTYQAIRNYLPLFEQFGTPELTAGLRTQLAALTAIVPESLRSQGESRREESTPQQRMQSMEQSVLDRIDRARTSAERDQGYLQLAIFRAASGDAKALDYVDKIDDSELRQSLRAYIDASMAWTAIEKKDAERALEIVRTGELTHLQKAWTMTGAARLLMSPKSGKPDRERALQLLDDAATEARRLGASDPDRPRAFLAITNALLAIDPARSWDSMSDAVRAANSAPEFTGEDGELTFRIISKGSRSMHQHSIPDFDLAGVFQRLANADFDRAVELARVFEREAPRAHAVMAIALTVLNEKKK